MKYIETQAPLNLLAIILLLLSVHNHSAAIDFEFYGRAHLSADLLDNGENIGSYISSNSSRIGIRGGEDLGCEDCSSKGSNDQGDAADEYTSKYRLIYQIESSVKIDRGTGEFATRNSYVGLISPAGRIIIGRHDTPFKKLRRRVELFPIQIGSARNIAGLGGYNWDLRPDNMIIYTTPAVAGFTATLGRMAEEGTPGGDLISFNLWFKNKNIRLGCGSERHGRALTGVDTDGDDEIDTLSPKAETGLRFAGEYKTDSVQLFLFHEILNQLTGQGGRTRQTTGLGAASTIKRLTIKAQCFFTGGTDNQSESGGRLLSLAGEWRLSQSSRVYLAIASVDNDQQAVYGVTGGAHGAHVLPVTGKDATGLSLGISHLF